MWKKRFELSVPLGKRLDFEHVGNPDENGAEYFVSRDSNGKKVLEIEFVSLIERGLGNARTYLLHLAELIKIERPEIIEWEVLNPETPHHQKLIDLYNRLGNEHEWSGIGFTSTTEPGRVAYSIANPKAFMDLILQKFGARE